MKTCPHRCAPLNFLRVMIMNRWTPYRCPKCKGEAVVPMWQLMLLGGLGGGSGAIVMTELIPRFGVLSFLFLGILVVLLTFAMVLFCSFQPQK